MIEVTGNLWDYPADFFVITTNGTLKQNGRVVMGRGCAKEARDRFPGTDFELGIRVKACGNHVFVLPNGIVTFPVKHNWWEMADSELIVRSAHELVEFADDFGHVLVNAPDDLIPYIDTSTPTFVMPRPGCGNGGLNWSEVKPLIETIFDDRFHVITF